MSEHLSKRQRTTGSFSPFHSPPYQSAKPGETKTPVVQHPNTPTSPPYMSMNSLSNGRPSTTSIAPLSEMTPPSSVTMSQQTSQISVSATHSLPFPTPASTTGVTFSTNIDSDGDVTMGYGQDDEALRSGEHRNSNHNRQRKGAVPAPDGVSGKALFKLSQCTHEVSRPHGSQNLFELYNLNDLARSVARTNPVTGEKINKLRKSYEGHIKAMQIAGKPKATKMDEAFTNLLPTRISDEDYFLQRVSGKQMDNALNVEQTGLSADFDSLLTRAFSGITSGPLPAAEMSKFKNYIGTDDSSKAKGPVEIVSKQPMPQRATTPLSANSSAAQKQYRPERHGAKRSYDESSFRGYGDGFADDNFADSTGGEDNGQGGMKKRRLAFERSSHSVEVGGARR